MVQSRGRPAPSEWAEIRAEFTTMYQDQNMKLKDIKQLLAERGFVATDRQYKTKVKAWDLDNKTIKRDTYHSMYVVMRHRQQMGWSSVFLVPIRGNDTNVVRPDKIIKEVNRNRSVLDANNMKRAQAILDKERVMVCTDDEREIFRLLNSPRPADTPRPSGLESYSVWPETMATDGSVLEGSAITTSPSHIDTSHAFRTSDEDESSFGRLSQGAISPSTSVTVSTFQSPLQSLSRSSFQSGDAGTSSGPGTFPQSTFSPEDLEMFDATCSLLDPSCSEQKQTGSSSCTQLNLTHSSYGLVDDERRLAIRWAMPYVRAFFDRRRYPAQIEFAGRSDARAAFKSMLQGSNRYIFPYCMWMLTVLASNHQTILLTEFLRDCCNVIDQDAIGYKLTYGSPLHLTLALYNANQADIEAHRAEFLASTNTIRMIWGEHSPNYLVNEHYHAWLLLERRQHEEARQILEHCLPICEQVMGRRHIVTINCLAILARGLGEMGRVADAIEMLHHVLDRLENCAEPLQAYRYRQLMRLAEHLTNRGDLVQAEDYLRAILAFRSTHLGMNCAATWKTIENLVSVLERQGRIQESGRLLREYTNLFNNDFEEEWYRRYQKPAPWLSQL